MSLRMERDGALAILTLDDPARRNPIGEAMRAALLDAFETLEADAGVRAVVLTGAGGHFCAGGDIAGMDVADLAEGRERFRRMHRLVSLMIQGSKPIVAAVEGWCVGGGLGLALCCDTIPAGADARFMAGFGRIGLLPDLGLLHTLPARVGMGRARQILLYDEPMAADAAAEAGLIDHLVEAGGALAAACARAARLAEAAPLSVALTRRMLAEGLEAALGRERDLQAALFLTADHASGKAAFRARRPAVFTGS